MNIAVIGTGYVGLVTGTCLAETGNNVTCVDIDHEKVARMQAGEIPIYEPGLEALFNRNIRQQRLHFTTELEQAVRDAQIVFLALPTPPTEDGSADLRYVLQVAHQLGELIADYKVIVNKSTVPVGTCDLVEQAIAKTAQGEFAVVSNPEFLREGVAVDDFMKPDRVVVGVEDERAKTIMGELYKPFFRKDNRILFMDRRSAEMTKYAANAFLATKITFMNEMANLCERLGADIDKVRNGIGSDERIGKSFLFAGAGYGGSCFPKDVRALVKTAEDNQYALKVLRSVVEVNDHQKVIIADKILEHFGQDLTGRTFAVWGLAFKPNTDDIREAPAIYVIEKLLAHGAKINAFDPEAMLNFRKRMGDRISYCDSMYDCLKGADALILLTEWTIFRNPDFDKIGESLRDKVIFDGRNLFELKEMEERGFYYNSIGRKLIEA